MQNAPSPFLFRLMLLKMLPLGFLAGLQLQRADDQACFVGIRYSYLTKNPFRSIYFAAQAMAAEMSTGLPALLHLRATKSNTSMLVTQFEASYFKKAVGKIQFRFEEVAALRQAIDQAGPSGTQFIAISRGYTTQNECVAEMRVHWSFKAR